MENEEGINEYIAALIEEKTDLWNTEIKFTEGSNIPEQNEISLEKPHWYKVRNIVAVYADMSGSTSVSIHKYRNPKTMGRIYEIFVGTLVRVFNEFGVNVVDIQGDGILGIWDGAGARYHAFAAAVTFKTFIDSWFANWVKQKTSDDVDIHVHTGMDEHHVYVKYIGMRGDKKNEVWAGEPVNIAVKLCNLAEKNEIIVSGRLYDAFKLEKIYNSCGCTTDREGNRTEGDKTELWIPYEFDENLTEELGFNRGWGLESIWCEVHGNEYCEEINNKE